MATIFGVTTTFAFPEEHTSSQNVSVGRSAAGTFKFLQYRSADRLIPIHLRLISQSTMLALKAALEGATNHQGAIVPDANIDLGNGAGTSVTAQWMDKQFAASRNDPNWNVDLNFGYIS
jgi:hypothetical protein